MCRFKSEIIMDAYVCTYIGTENIMLDVNHANDWNIIVERKVTQNLCLG